MIKDSVKRTPEEISREVFNGLQQDIKSYKNPFNLINLTVDAKKSIASIASAIHKVRSEVEALRKRVEELEAQQMNDIQLMVAYETEVKIHHPKELDALKASLEKAEAERDFLQRTIAVTPKGLIYFMALESNNVLLKEALAGAFHRESCPDKGLGTCEECIDGIKKMEVVAQRQEESKPIVFGGYCVACVQGNCQEHIKPRHEGKT